MFDWVGTGPLFLPGYTLDWYVKKESFLQNALQYFLFQTCKTILMGSYLQYCSFVSGTKYLGVGAYNVTRIYRKLKNIPNEECV